MHYALSVGECATRKGPLPQQGLGNRRVGSAYVWAWAHEALHVQRKTSTFNGLQPVERDSFPLDVASTRWLAPWLWAPVAPSRCVRRTAEVRGCAAYQALHAQR